MNRSKGVRRGVRKDRESQEFTKKTDTIDVSKRRIEMKKGITPPRIVCTVTDPEEKDGARVTYEPRQVLRRQELE